MASDSPSRRFSIRLSTRTRDGSHVVRAEKTVTATSREEAEMLAVCWVPEVDEAAGIIDFVEYKASITEVPE